MAQAVIDDSAPQGPSTRLVITASALGTVFEWYDFFVYGILAALLGRLFFPAGDATAATLASLAAFGAGFGVRPLGALLFGWFGDRLGRKVTFLVTITLMGLATAAIGFLPTFAAAGIAAPVLLVGLRLLQGLALGGEYGGAAIYVAEHAPEGQRGRHTSFIQMSVVGGFLLAVIMVLVTRHATTPEQFEDWGWRIPFAASLVMLAISLYIRLKLSESPVFQAMKAAGTTSRNPFKDSLQAPGNLGRVMVALFGVAAGLTVVYYTSQFGTLYFLQGTARVPEEEALLYMAVGAGIATPLYWLCGALSDKVGRKKLLLIGYALSALLTFPIFHLMANAANPALERATAASPVRLELPSCDFSIFAPKQTEPCAKALSWLAKRGVRYEKVEAADVTLTVGNARVPGFDEQGIRCRTEGRELSRNRQPGRKTPAADHSRRRADGRAQRDDLWPGRGDFGRNVPARASATPRCPCPIISVRAISAVSCRSSRSTSSSGPAIPMLACGTPWSSSPWRSS